MSTWKSYKWPRFVPRQVREQIMDFWSENYGRNPEQWIKGTVDDAYNKHPKIGTRARGTEPLWKEAQRILPNDVWKVGSVLEQYRAIDCAGWESLNRELR